MLKKYNDLDDRQVKLLSLVNDAGHQTIVELAKVLNCSEQTVRRDIKKLDDLSLLCRCHGGARALPSHEDKEGLVNQSIQTRSHINVSEKRAIAREVVKIIPDHAVIFITIGSTVEAIAQELCKSQKPLTVITNSIRVAYNLHDSPAINVMIPSGAVANFNGGIEGPNVLNELNKFKPDFVVTSVGAIENNGQMLDFNFSNTEVVRQMIHLSKSTIIAADYSKFSTVASVQLENIKDVNYFVTDQTPPASILDVINSSNVKLIVANQDSDANSQAI